ncbi:hypothetical protein GH733_014764, partial [Mirounga leonina]
MHLQVPQHQTLMVPWPVKGTSPKHKAGIAAACQTFLKLNDYLQIETMQALEELTCKEISDIDAMPGLDVKNRAAYSVTLLNCMGPQKMPYLKEEPYFGKWPLAGIMMKIWWNSWRWPCTVIAVKAQKRKVRMTFSWKAEILILGMLVLR